jgi:hypothetical protein
LLRIDKFIRSTMMYFGIPKFVRFFVYFMTVVDHVRGSHQHHENSGQNGNHVKRLQYEFGRTTSRTLLGDFFDFERYDMPSPKIDR